MFSTVSRSVARSSEKLLQTWLSHCELVAQNPTVAFAERIKKNFQWLCKMKVTLNEEQVEIKY